MILVTGAAGFIGSNFVNSWFVDNEERVISYDNLTYAGNVENLHALKENKKHIFIKGDISDSKKLTRLLAEYKPRAVINFAAESHVDRSISSPKVFFETNVIGTYNLLESSKNYWENLERTCKQNFLFLHVSTDEVYGSLTKSQDKFKESSQYRPNSPYSASKASSDHIIRSFYKTYDFPAVTSNCSNNYGPFQFPEKLIPMTILNLIDEKKVPLYGDGKQIRDWIHVNDHCDALKILLEKSKVGEVYNIGGNNEMENLEVVKMICLSLDKKMPRKKNLKYVELISFVKDRAGHDQRYAIDSSKAKIKLGWEAKKDFKIGIDQTIQWYLDNPKWVKNIVDRKS